MHELVALGNDADAALAVARAVDGVAYTAGAAAAADERPKPFATLVRAVTDDLDVLAPAAGAGLHVVFARVVRTRAVQPDSGDPSPGDPSPGEPSPGITAVFPLVRRSDLSHAAADRHWRDVHAPLALRHHPGMWDYTQLSVVATLAGDPLDGFALVAFESADDMRERFFGNDDDRAAIVADIAKFADLQRSPRRVVTTEVVFGRRPPVPVRT